MDLCFCAEERELGSWRVNKEETREYGEESASKQILKQLPPARPDIPAPSLLSTLLGAVSPLLLIAFKRAAQPLFLGLCSFPSLLPKLGS